MDATIGHMVVVNDTLRRSGQVYGVCILVSGKGEAEAEEDWKEEAGVF